jgi:glycosyltransferase involved in cell wall biosynthesis
MEPTTQTERPSPGSAADDPPIHRIGIDRPTAGRGAALPRIMQVMAGAAHGGAETFFVDLVTALHEAGFPQRAVIRRNAERAAILRSAGVEVTELGFGGWFDLVTKPALRREIAAYRPDIVQTWMVRATRACPAGDFVHVGWLGGYYKPQNFRACDHVVGVTRDIVRHLGGADWPAGRAHYLPTFANYAPASPLRRADYDTPEDAPLLLALGRLHVKKGFDVLLQALCEVPKAWLWLAGEGELRGKLEEQVTRLGLGERVRFLGWRYDREALFATADLCVFPSRYEPFGTITVEAWANKTPLIAAASAGPAATIRDGADGLLVPIDDARALSAAINRVLGDPDLARSLVEGGWRRYQKDYTRESCVEKYRHLYATVLGGVTAEHGRESPALG